MLSSKVHQGISCLISCKVILKKKKEIILLQTVIKKNRYHRTYIH